MASPNETFTELVTTTLRHRKREVVDNVTKHNALLTWMKKKGKIKTDAAGGTEIVLPLSYPENNTYQRYSGYDTLNIAASEVLTSAKYDWRQAAIHVTSNGREIRINSGKEAMIRLVKSRVDVAIATAANNMAIDIYSDGALSNQIGGLDHIVPAAGTGTVGGINSSTYTWWQSKFKETSNADGTAMTYSVLRSAMNELYLSLCRGVDKPDLAIMSHDFFAVFEGGLQDLQRYGSAESAKVGFPDALMYKNVPVIFDDNTNFGTTSENVYMLNCDYLYLMEHPEARWTEDGRKTPINQDAVVIPMYWMGQMCCSNRSLQGRVVDLT